jgi:hypothetical protein
MIESKKQSSIDFSDISIWYSEKLKELRNEAMILEKKRLSAVRASLKEKKRQEQEKRIKRKKKKIKLGKHKMVRRSDVNKVIESEGKTLDVNAAVRFHMSTVHGISKCQTCEILKETKYFSLIHFKYGNLRTVSPNCIRCSAMTGYDKDPLLWFSKYITSEAKNRAENNGIPFDITSEWVMQRYKRLQSKCELCDSHMTLFKRDYRQDKKEKISFMKNPTNMSLDQIVPGKGYTKDNVQLVNLQCNLAKLDVPQSDFVKMCIAVAAKFS